MVVFLLECCDFVVGCYELVNVVECLVVLFDFLEDVVFDELVEVFLCCFDGDFCFVCDLWCSLRCLECLSSGMDLFILGYWSMRVVLGFVGYVWFYEVVKYIFIRLEICVEIKNNVCLVNEMSLKI